MPSDTPVEAGGGEGRRRRTSRPSRPGPPAPGTAYEAGVRLLSRRPHSRQELARKLLRRGHAAEEVELAVSRMVEVGYLDDAGYAEMVVRHRSSTRGRRMIEAELVSRGVGKELAGTALEDLNPEAEMAAAERLARSGARNLPGGDFRQLLDRVGPKLLRRGFSFGVAREACRRVFAADATPS